MRVIISEAASARNLNLWFLRPKFHDVHIGLHPRTQEFGNFGLCALPQYPSLHLKQLRFAFLLGLVGVERVVVAFLG
jgi:hypothetical protein